MQTPKTTSRWAGRLAALAAVSALVTTGAMWTTQRDVDPMASAADAFLASLSSEQRQQASFAFDVEERVRWHFIPVEMFARKGLMLNDMTATQRERAHALLRAGLSQRGYLTATQVMELEDVLLAIEGGGRMARDSGEYFFSVFGTPEEDKHLRVYDAGHWPLPMNDVIRETVDLLDLYLGPVGEQR